MFRTVALAVAASVAMGCASAVPAWGTGAPTDPSAPAAPRPPVATALTSDPVPPPEETGGGHAHHGMSERPAEAEDGGEAPAERPEDAPGDPAPEEPHGEHGAEHHGH